MGNNIFVGGAEPTWPHLATGLNITQHKNEDRSAWYMHFLEATAETRTLELQTKETAAVRNDILQKNTERITNASMREKPN